MQKTGSGFALRKILFMYGHRSGTPCPLGTIKCYIIYIYYMYSPLLIRYTYHDGTILYEILELKRWLKNVSATMYTRVVIG